MRRTPYLYLFIFMLCLVPFSKASKLQQATNQAATNQTTPSAKLLFQLPNTELTESFYFSLDGSVLMTEVDGKSETLLWDVKTGKLVQRLSLTGGSWIISPDRMTIATWNSEDKKSIKLIDATTLKPKLTLSGHERDVETARFSPDGKTIASAEGNIFERNSPKAKIKLWNAETGKLIQTLEANRWGVASLAFSPDSKRLASGHAELAGSAPQVMLWDVNTGKELARDQVRGYAFGLAFSPDGKLLAGGSVGGVHGYDTTLELVQLWDTETLKPIKKLASGSGRFLPIVNWHYFSLDGKTLINRKWGRWDVETGKLKPEPKEYGEIVFSPDERIFASLADDKKSLKLWRVSE